ncbi:MAG: bifunctional glutamate N-acetyltransferase/amino-acid acetyltransferase ArgJ, partial [Pseudomonadota bacterium]
FRAAATAAGIKKTEGALDVGLVFSEAEETAAAAVFTTNLVAAAPVVLSRANLKSNHGWARAALANAGNANAATGKAGYQASLATAKETARLLQIPENQVLVASTGVIGVPLDARRIQAALPTLCASLSAEWGDDFARAIMTTDTFPKCCVLRARINGKTAHIAGVAKGAGMIHPRMATMLAFITTDVAVRPRDLQRFLRLAADASFNRITVDGDTSTNDTVLVLASGLSGVQVAPGGRAAATFLEGLTQLSKELGRMIARDGEGAKKLVTIKVRGAKTAADADRAARAIANSALVKTAIAGSDPNWGRILCAAGYSGAKFDPAKTDILVNSLYLCRRGLDTGFDENAARRELDGAELTITVDLHTGHA